MEPWVKIRVLQSHLSAFSSFGRCVLNCSVPPEIPHRGHCFEVQSTFKGNAIAISLNFQKQKKFTHLSNQWVLPPTVLSSSGKTRKIKGKQTIRVSSFSDWNSVPKLGQLYFSNEDNHTRLGKSIPLWIKNKKNLLERITFKSHQTFLVFTASTVWWIHNTGGEILYLANCSSSQIWGKGRLHPFGQFFDDWTKKVTPVLISDITYVTQR